MISYYNSRNPGLFAYSCLLLLSTLYFCFIPVENWSLGLLLMGWSVYTFMRALSLFEVTENPAPLKGLPHTSRTTLLLPASLPHDLMKRMNGKDHLNRANLSLQALSARSTLWLALAAIYAVCELYLSQHGLSQSQNAFSFAQKTAILFILGASFWAGQTYASSDILAKLIGFLFAALIIAGIATGRLTFAFTPLAADTLLSPSHLIALPLFAYSFIMLFPSLFKTKAYALNACAGIGILLFMSCLILMFPANTAQIAVLISGWSLFSLCWIRSTHMLKKTYTLRV